MAVDGEVPNIQDIVAELLTTSGRVGNGDSDEDSIRGCPSEKLEMLRRRAYVSLGFRGVTTEADVAEWPHKHCVPTLLQVASAIGDHGSVDELLRRARKTGIPYRAMTLELARSWARVGAKTSGDDAAIDEVGASARHERLSRCLALIDVALAEEAARGGRVE